MNGLGIENFTSFYAVLCPLCVGKGPADGMVKDVETILVYITIIIGHLIFLGLLVLLFNNILKKKELKPSPTVEPVEEPETPGEEKSPEFPKSSETPSPGLWERLKGWLGALPGAAAAVLGSIKKPIGFLLLVGANNMKLALELLFRDRLWEHLRWDSITKMDPLTYVKGYGTLVFVLILSFFF